MNPGKKIFFLYPYRMIEEELITEIFHHEYEVYMLHDHVKAVKLFEKYNNSIVFINIDEKLPEKVWEGYIRKLRHSAATKDILIGIISNNDNQELKRKYLIDIGIQAGYVILKHGITKINETILKVLEANEAKGLRKYVRVICPPDINTVFNFKLADKIITGSIRDISSFAMACTLGNNITLPVKTVLKDMQLVLKNVIVRISGVVATVRNGLHIVLFSQKTDYKEKIKIQKFVRDTLQYNIDSEMKRI